MCVQQATPTHINKAFIVTAGTKPLKEDLHSHRAALAGGAEAWQDKTRRYNRCNRLKRDSIGFPREQNKVEVKRVKQ
jgi:hypothetical protein